MKKDLEKMSKYTKEEVQILLEQQRENCYKSARIERFEYVNPYSDSDGKIETRINKESILNAKNPINEV